MGKQITRMAAVFLCAACVLSMAACRGGGDLTYYTYNKLEYPDTLSNISTRSVTRKSGNYAQIAHYPVTPFDGVNDQVQAWVDGRMDEFAGSYAQYLDQDQSIANENYLPQLSITYETHVYNDTIVTLRLRAVYTSLTKTSEANKTITYHAATGAVMGIKDFFEQDAGVLNRLSAFVQNQVLELLKAQGDHVYDPDKAREGTSPTESNFHSFVVGENSLTFYFDPAQVAPNSPGSVEIIVPFTRVEDILKVSALQKSKDAPPALPSQPEPEPISLPEPEQLKPYKGAAKYVALIFSDGPDPAFTQALVTALDRRDAKATFYPMASRIQANAALLQSMESKGYQLGGQVVSGRQIPYMTAQEYEKEIQLGKLAFSRVLGHDPSTLHPSFGSYSDKTAAWLDRPMICGNLRVDDTALTAEEVRDKITANVKNMEMVSLTDGTEAGVRGAVMAVDELRQKGYRFVTVDELFAQAKTEMKNQVYRNAKS